ncbi:unnamed protein product [Rhizoctonia solani]|nr:unnamed protein product [Rhizoctonia solani]
MDIHSSDADLILELRGLETHLLRACASGVDAYTRFATRLEGTLQRAHQRLPHSNAPEVLAQVMNAATRSCTSICIAFSTLEDQFVVAAEKQTAAIQDMFARAGFKRRRKRAAHSRKSKAGKNGRMRQSGKKSKRGRKSPVGNPKRRAPDSQGNPGPSTDNGRKSRNVIAPPTDSMKFGESKSGAFYMLELTSTPNPPGACRDFFLSHLGDPYPTTVQKHQILKQSSPDFTLRSLNLWFVNIRRRSKWMDIFKKHAGSKRDAMRDLVARVEAQVAGRPAPNPLPSGAAPPGCKVDQAIVEEVMAMRAIVDMVSREVYGEGWDQILQIRPWTDEEVRAHEERKKATRRNARENKVDGEKKKQDREARKEQRKREREERKRIEQSAVHGIHAARELHERLMAMNKRKRDDNDDDAQSSPKRRKEGPDENDGPQKVKVRVPKVDENGNPLSKKERKALKKAMLAAQANPLKRKSPEFGEDASYPSAFGDTDAFPDGLSPSKRRRRDAATFEGFPGAGENDQGGLTDLTQLFAIEWASPTTSAAQLPRSENSPTPVPAPVSTSSFDEFAHPAESQVVPMPAMQTGLGASAEIAGEPPRRYSQQLAAYALESGMFGGDNFELFTEDTFPNMSVDLNQESNMGPFLQTDVANHQSVGHTPVQTESHTAMANLGTPIETQAYSNFPPPNHPPPSPPYSSSSTITPNGDADSDMSWLNAALAQLPSEHDAQHQHHFSNAPGPQDGSGYNAGYTGNQNAYNQPVYAAPAESRAPVSHQRTSMEYAAPQPPQHQPQPQHHMHAQQTPSIAPTQPRRSFPHGQSHSSASSFPHPQPQPSRRAPGSLWQTPYSQPQSQPQQYHPPTPSFPAPPPPPSPSRSFPAPAQHHYDPTHDRRHAYTHSVSPQEYQPAPAFPQPQYTHAPSPAPAPAPAPVPDAASILKQHELEFARAQEELRNRFKREQDEQLERFLRAQDELKKQLLPEGRSRS